MPAISQKKQAMSKLTESATRTSGIPKTLVRNENLIIALPIFFGSLRTPGASDGQIVMVDYRGRQLISNQLEAIPENEALLLGVINEGKTYFHVNTERLIYVVPIFYHNLPEGALYVTYQREQFAQLFGLAKDGDYMIVLNESNQVVYSTYPQEQKILPWDEQLDNWLVATEELRGAGGIKIVTGVSKDTAFAGVRNIKNMQKKLQEINQV